MKKPRGIERAVQPIDRDALDAIPTEALLARLKRLRWSEESTGASDLGNAEIASVSHLILFKDDPVWRSAFSDLKEVLAGRGHVTG